MKAGLAEIVGKKIVGALAATNDDAPNIQVFLLFSDGTYFEFWGDSFSCSSGVKHGGDEAARQCATQMGGTITSVYPKS